MRVRVPLLPFARPPGALIHSPELNANIVGLIEVVDEYH
jgi:hypothetical protein